MRFAPTPTSTPSRAIARAARVVHVTLAAQVVSVGALVIFEEVRGRQLAAELAAFGGRPSGADAEALAGAATAFALLLLLAVATTIAAATAYTTWLVRVRVAGRMPAARSAVAAAWLIPGVNLLAPAVLVYETWRASGPPREGRHGRAALVTGWWLSWLATVAVFTLVLPLDALDSLTGLGLLEFACLALAALLCAATVHRITALQHSSSTWARAKPPALVTPASHLDPAA